MVRGGACGAWTWTWVTITALMPTISALQIRVNKRGSEIRMQYGQFGGQYVQQGGVPPQQAGYPPQQPGGYGQGSWRVCSTKGVCYTVRNGEQQVLGRFDLDPQPPTVSRMKCMLQVGNDGTATMVSLGRGPTGVRENYNTPWAWLQKDQRAYTR